MKARTLQHIAFALFLIAGIIVTARLFTWIGMHWMYTELPTLYRYQTSSNSAPTFLHPNADSETLRTSWMFAIALASIPLSFYAHVQEWTEKAIAKA